MKNTTQEWQEKKNRSSFASHIPQADSTAVNLKLYIEIQEWAKIFDIKNFDFILH